MEVEAVRRIAEPLRLASDGEDLTAEVKDPEFARVARYCQGTACPPELGSLARFLRTAAHSRKRAETSVLVAALRATTTAWPSADWLFVEGGFTDIVDLLTREYRNLAAHTALFGEEDFSRCSDLVHPEASQPQGTGC